MSVMTATSCRLAGAIDRVVAPRRAPTAVARASSSVPPRRLVVVAAAFASSRPRAICVSPRGARAARGLGRAHAFPRRRAIRARAANAGDDGSGADAEASSSSSSSSSSTTSTRGGVDENEKDAAGDVVQGVEVPSPGSSSGSGNATKPDDDDDAANDADSAAEAAPAPAPRADRAKLDSETRRPLSFFQWFVRMFQPLRLISFAVNTFLFLFAAQLFTQDNPTGATHVVPVSYSRFLSAVKGDDVQTLSVDGSYLTWKPKTALVIKRKAVGSPLSMAEPEKIEVAYSAARPDDATVPYDLLHKNKVEFGAVDKRQKSQRNVNTFITLFIVGVAMVQLNRIGQRGDGSENRAGPGGRGGGGPFGGGGGFGRGGLGGPNTSAGRMSGGKQRGSLPPPSTTFADVAGVDEAKEELAEIVDILKRPEHYTRLGARPPSGVLLVGAPGTGKTLLARAVAGEAGVPFISVSASEFVELYVGMGAARVRDVFQRAREQAPSIVFIDEIDAVAKGRSDGKMRGMGNDEREQTLNQLLTELDGFDSGELVICLAATNRADTLDTALKRPGRFDRTVSVERPDKQGRKEILGVHISNRRLPLDPAFRVDDIAQMTAGFTGAELANLVNEAALLAGRKGATIVGKLEFENAVLRTVAGIEKKRSLLSPSEKVTVSAHEAGHAVVGTAVGFFIPGTQRPEALSIVARSGGALGYTYIPPGEEDRKLMFSDELRGRLVTLMGGRAAEIVACGRVSTGAMDDIQRATDLAYKAVAEYGLSPTVGPMSVPVLSAGGGEDAFFGGGDTAQGANKQVETEVKATLISSLYVAKLIVEENIAVLKDMASALSEREKIGGEDLDEWLNDVEAPATLERFLRGENPQPPEGSELWSMLPLPAFPSGGKGGKGAKGGGAGAR
jgi:cell division protease FtsH